MEQQTTLNSVAIGKQVWATRNLDVTTFRNGDPIFEAKTDMEWLDASQSKKPACCCFNFDGGHAAHYGRLYNGYAVSDPRGLAPEGWHVPSEAEWRELTNFLVDGDSGYKMKTADGWYNRGGGSNQSGFSGLPGGECTYGGGFIMQGSHGFWWGSTVDKSDSAFSLVLVNNSWNTGKYFYDRSQGQSVRCLKD
jgi:uncharacterized protein (TIGR02145 family)